MWKVIEELLKRYSHQIEAMILPGLFLVGGAFFIIFYPSFLTWGIAVLGFLLPILAVLGIISGFMVSHPLGKWIEKIFIETMLRKDLKRVDAIHKIVGQKKANALIKKYKLDANTNFEDWRSTIRKMRSKLKEGNKEKQTHFNNHNKQIRGYLADCLVLFVIGYIKYGNRLKPDLSSGLIILGAFLLVFLLVSKMRDNEKRELQIIYEG